MSNNRLRPSAHFFTREPDGGVRLRLRFNNEVASLIEEAAGREPLMNWIYKTLETTAREQVRADRAQRPTVAPPD
jgi:hypothetical protein